MRIRSSDRRMRPVYLLLMVLSASAVSGCMLPMMAMMGIRASDEIRSEKETEPPGRVEIDEEALKSEVGEYIASRSGQGGGYFQLTDERTGEPLDLEFVRIHDPVRRVEGKGAFVTADFQPPGAEPGQRYELEFWLEPEAKRGKYAVTYFRILKHPKRVGAGWIKESRHDPDEAIEPR